jgi:S-adenosyl-L-methionine hydrolase (adenosine-forming)
MPSVIALLSDFGTRDQYAGTMKGVMLAIAPDAVFVDLTHEIPPHDVLHGAIQLAAAVPHFPSGTIFLAVVDPGVGTARRGLVVEAGDYRFVAPDNGLLTAALQRIPPRRIVALTEGRYARPTMSRTFEGRDRFAPAAAWLARGVDLAAFGASLDTYEKLHIPRPEVAADQLRGTVLYIDRFGNAVTNIDRAAFDRFTRGAEVAIAAPGLTNARLVSTYSDIDDDEICGLFGSTDHLELAARSASAAVRLGVDAGALVEMIHLPSGQKR